jgi:hypothetical protein
LAVARTAEVRRQRDQLRHGSDTGPPTA